MWPLTATEPIGLSTKLEHSPLKEFPMKLLILSNLVALAAGGILGYVYGAFVYTKAENIIKAAQNLELAAKTRLKALL